jgi:WD domain, G-beta repeat.
MSYDNKYLAVGDDYGYLYVFDYQYNHIKDFQAHKGPIRDMVFLYSGQLVTGGGDSIITIWNLSN